MAQMGDIKRRIKSVNSTMQITNAMYLVSSAKVRKAREKVDQTRPYTEAIIESIKRILSTTKGISHPFLEKREVKKTAYIILSSDRGLAGGFNANLMKAAEEDLKDRNKDDITILSYGAKARDYFERRGYDIEFCVTGITEDPDYVDARRAGDMLIKKYKEGEIDEVKLVYTKFYSVISQEPEVIQLLPAEMEVEEEVENEDDKKDLTLTEYDPSPEVVLDYLIPKYINGAIYGALIESSASQQGARMTAMESATNNARDMIDSLGLLYNRARQASITQEITEIVAGADAQA
ncbi:MAG: ATP synthase F1 subunit gamma [Andreesenia angusta]|nr:ATP synthase F1 subunit gamma [Andreesenia angusta]